MKDGMLGPVEGAGPLTGRNPRKVITDICDYLTNHYATLSDFDFDFRFQSLIDSMIVQ